MRVFFAGCFLILLFHLVGVPFSKASAYLRIMTADIKLYQRREYWQVYNSQLYLLADIDECTDGSDNCDEGYVCTNIIGSYTCSCDTGYAWGGEACSGVYKIRTNIE